MEEDWTAEKIKRELKLRGFNVTDVARQAGVTIAAISNSINGHQRSLSGDDVICGMLGGVDKSTVWPSRYRVDDTDVSTPTEFGGWSKSKIKAEVRKQGFSLAELDRFLGLPTRSVGQSLINRRPKTDKAIAEFLGVCVSDIWPERYYITGAEVICLKGSRPNMENIRKVNHAFAQEPRPGNRPAQDRVVNDENGVFRLIRGVKRVQLPPGVL